VIGAQSFQVYAPDGYFTYVIGNKKNLIVDDEGNLVVKSKEDFRQFRMIASSVQLQWSGLEIYKNGTYNIARITDSENLASFNPNSKIDAVTCNMSDVIVATSQRATATTPLIPVDPNSEDAGGVRPDGGIKRAHESIVATGGLPSSMDSGTLMFTFAANTTMRTLATGIQDAMINFYNSNGEYKRIFDTFISALTAKYPNFWNSEGNTYNMGVKFEISATATMVGAYQSVHMESKPTNLTWSPGQTISNSSLFAEIVTQSVSAISTAPINPISIGARAVVFTCNMLLDIPIDGRINQRVQIPNFLALGVDENSLADTVYYDNGFLEPVIQAVGNQIQVQVITSHSFEFLLSDDTVLAAAAVANTPKDPEAVVSKAEYNKFQSIMKGMPPGLIMGDLGLARISATQLASRGILSDIKNVLGPIASSIFPNSSGMINTVGGIIDML
jgi:hypothetical protein